jgi:osmotically-inducible protein OsmY
MQCEHAAEATDLDLDLARRVKNVLYQRPELRHVTVKAYRGSVVLQGIVTCFYHKQLSISGSQRVSGVYELVDKIVVTSNSGSTQAK